MKAYVNENCIGCGLCVGICPEVFEMTDEDVAQVIAEVSEEMESQAVEAQESLSLIHILKQKNMRTGSPKTMK